jgi:hypothetical protein
MRFFLLWQCNIEFEMKKNESIFYSYLFLQVVKAVLQVHIQNVDLQNVDTTKHRHRLSYCKILYRGGGKNPRKV